MPCDHLISVRVDDATKQRFRDLASRQGLSESALLKRLLDVAMLGTAGAEGASGAAMREARGARLYVRLNPVDRRLLTERASRRQMPSATYVALLVRAHLIDQPPLPSQELATLKLLIGEISAIGRNLNQYVRAVHACKRGDGFDVEDAKSLIKVCLRVGEWTRELIAKNAASWRAGDPRG
jgi:hypothetical protein